MNPRCFHWKQQVYVWIALKTEFPLCLAFFYGSRALFTGPTSTKFSNNNFKIGSYGTIHTFKNYFAIVFSVFSNKRYPNRPAVYYINFKKLFNKKIIFFCMTFWTYAIIFYRQNLVTKLVVVLYYSFTQYFFHWRWILTNPPLDYIFFLYPPYLQNF